MIFITHNKSTKVLKPGKQTLNLPSLSVSPQYPTILSRRLDTVALVRSNNFNTSLPGQTYIKSVAVVSSIAYNFVRNTLQKTSIKSFVDKRYFMRAGACCVNGDRKTESVCKAHNFGSFAPFGFAHTIAPFLAGANVPSIKPSLKSMPPRSFRSLANSVRILAKTPNLVHSWKRRWHVLLGGYLSGKSAQGAPVRKIQRMPFSTALISCGGRPDFPGLAFGFGIKSLILCHCSFVRSIDLKSDNKTT
jgi:hypothetical protein